MIKKISLAIIMLVNISFANDNSSCDILKEARKTFLKTYKEGNIKSAYETLDNIVSKIDIGKSDISELACKDSSILIWAYSDLAFASLKLNDIYECTKYYSDINDYLDTYKNTKAIKAYLYNINQCKTKLKSNTSLINGDINMTEVQMPTQSEQEQPNEDDPIENRADKYFASQEEVSQYIADFTKYENETIKIGDTKGKLLITPYVKIEDKDTQLICPKLYFVQENGEKNYLGSFGKDLSDDVDDCCSFSQDKLYIKNTKDGVDFAINGEGYDCFGGTASYFFNLNFNIDKSKKVTYKNGIIYGVH